MEAVLFRLLGKNRDIDQEYICARQINFKAAACLLITAVASLLRLFSNAAVQPAVADVIVAVGIPAFNYVPAKAHMLKLSVASLIFLLLPSLLLLVSQLLLAFLL